MPASPGFVSYISGSCYGKRLLCFLVNKYDPGGRDIVHVETRREKNAGIYCFNQNLSSLKRLLIIVLPHFQYLLIRRLHLCLNVLKRRLLFEQQVPNQLIKPQSKTAGIYKLLFYGTGKTL